MITTTHISQLNEVEGEFLFIIDSDISPATAALDSSRLASTVKRKFNIIVSNESKQWNKARDLANNVISLNAICDICNQKAYHTYRKSKSTKTIMLGEKKEYLALCKQCFNEKTKKNG